MTAASPAYHRAHRDAHLKKFPNVDARTREALEDLIARAERREIVQRARVS